MIGIYLALIDEPSDKEKFNEIYYRYKDMMFCKAMTILHNASLSEEAVQESFLKIAKNISKISETDCSKTAAFIVIIIRNTAINMLKSEHMGETISIDEVDEIADISDISNDMLSMLISREGYEILVSALKSLDKKYCDVLMLKLVYEYSIEDISAMLKIPKRTIESRIYRGRKQLIKLLEDTSNDASENK